MVAIKKELPANSGQPNGVYLQDTNKPFTLQI